MNTIYTATVHKHSGHTSNHKQTIDCIYNIDVKVPPLKNISSQNNNSFFDFI
ncbi:hypothetical protein VCHA43P273_20145 [Vibrio chagasii]|nr:hypothetical protein VCHA43P273_20145 [Vibrio chagasii]